MKNKVERKVELEAFIEFLKDRCGFKFDVNSFDHRIKLQKYVFIAKFLGWEHGYSYNIYLKGPYSPDLTKDYYTLSGDSTSFEYGRYSDYLPELNMERFISVIDGKDTSWLEVATTMLSLYKRYHNTLGSEELKKYLLERTGSIKSNMEMGFIEDALNDLKRYELIQI